MALDIYIDKLDWIVINPSCKSLCRVWYKQKLRAKLSKCDAVSGIDASVMKYNWIALHDMGLVSADSPLEFDEHQLELMTRFPTRRMPLIRGNNSLLASFSEI